MTKTWFHIYLLTSFPLQNGFRRIGRTPFLAYSPDPSHPSRRLPIASDPETASMDFDSTNHNAPDLSADELRAQYPVHYEIVNNKTPSVAQVIRTAYQVDAGSVHKRDVIGFMPVHVAAARENVCALRTLLELDPNGMAEDLKDEKNKEGMTPLEGLESSMRSTKELAETLLGTWNGYSDESLSCEYLLKKAMGSPVTATEAEYIRKRRFGSQLGSRCTCGTCMDGWLSPRMRFRLLSEFFFRALIKRRIILDVGTDISPIFVSYLAQSEIQHDTLRMETPSFKSRQPLSPFEFLPCALDYVPSAVRQEMYKTFYVGFYTIFDAISQVLKTPGIPTPQAVMAEALQLDPRAVQFYLGKGGRVEYVLDAIVNTAREQSNLGDGTFEETFDCDEEEGGGGRLGYRKLVKCGNDLEFEVVRRGVGLGAVKMGPYDDDDGEGMDVDEYDDSESD